MPSYVDIWPERRQQWRCNYFYQVWRSLSAIHETILYIILPLDVITKPRPSHALLDEMARHEEQPILRPHSVNISSNRFDELAP